MLDKQTRETIDCHLKSGDLQNLFIEIGWNHPSSRQPETVSCGDQEFLLLPIAQKQGVMIYRCDIVPDAQLRRKIEKHIKKLIYEHLIVFVSPDNSKQVWQWVARKKGEPAKCREHTWQTDKSPEPLIQKLAHITFSLEDELEDENELTIAGALQRLQSAFDQEKVTKKFYDAFKKEYEKFRDFIEGLNKTADKELYASLMLNRLMFVYFIQKRGFLVGDINYLKNHFDIMQETKGRDKLHSFYRAFLLRFFHYGLAIPKDLRDKETTELIGDIPYLNGGLFELHAFEGGDSEIKIPDEAFEAIFSFFDEYQWTLDTRSTEKADANQINPDVLGHIFEKFINQKQMGAYYTKEDITGYITQNTVIPWLFRKVQSNDKDSFAPDGFVWKQLRENSDSYIYKDVAHGTDLELPKSISAGIKDVSMRGDWNKEASEEHGLPTEIWRETVERRQRHSDIIEKITSGEIAKIEDLITYNLNISQFAQDVIWYTESPDFVRAFWDAIKDIKVLDPACGSGAFLFASLNVLHDIYEACLNRMEIFVQESSKTKNVNDNISDFKKVLKQVKDRNRSYFIYKEIILYNLYGVDIMNDAVEICKLRLFLKLASELNQDEGIEALPDIDFNIRAGNSLIGYTSAVDMENAIKAGTEKFDFDDRTTKIKKTVEELAKEFNRFRKKQMKLGGKVGAEDKKSLRDKLEKFTDELDIFLSQDYEIKLDDFENWRERVKPFHWWAEFYDIIDKDGIGEGGFDAIIGNPPFLEASAVKYSPKRFNADGTIQGYFVEQSNKILSREGGMSMVFPLALVSGKRMKDVQDIIETGRSTWYSSFSIRSAKLFDGVDIRIAIFISNSSPETKVFSTGYKRWVAKTREMLMPTLYYTAVSKLKEAHWVPKFQSHLDISIFDKVVKQKLLIGEICGKGSKAVYYRRTGVGYWCAFTNFSPKFLTNGVSGTGRTLEKEFIKKEYESIIVVAVLSSNIFYWWYTVVANMRDMMKSDIKGFRTNPNIFNDNDLLELGKEYLADIKANSYMQTREQRNTGTIQTQSFKIRKSKLIIDKIDEMLSRYYGFTAEELDFIQNYDIKFRVDTESDGE